MSQEELQEPAASEIRFDRAEFGASSAATSCALCNEPLAGNYFEINGVMACPPCRDKVSSAVEQGSRAGRFLRAVAGGLAAAVLGAGIYYAVLAITDYQIGLIAVVVGFLVGGAVRCGSYGRGGWRYQTLAMTLTYVAIVSTYMPFLFKATQKQADATPAVSTAAPDGGNAGADASTAQAAVTSVPAAKSGASAAPGGPPVSFGGLLFGFVAIAGVVLALPFLAGFENFMGWLIIGFAVYQAWKMNRKRQLLVSGPFRLAPAAAPEPVPA